MNDAALCLMFDALQNVMPWLGVAQSLQNTSQISHTNCLSIGFRS